jgi:tRNA pseudouridine38-40 synthase
VYHCWTPLDVAAMQEAAGRLMGEHDFAAFASTRHGRKSTVRTIHDCHIEQPDTADALLRDQLHIVVSGNGFLYNMVRIIAGTLVDIGRGRWGSEHVDRLLAEPNRRDAGPTLPPEGLCLEWVRYGEFAPSQRPRAEAGQASDCGLTDDGRGLL